MVGNGLTGIWPFLELGDWARLSVVYGSVLVVGKGQGKFLRIYGGKFDIFGRRKVGVFVTSPFS